VVFLQVAKKTTAAVQRCATIAKKGGNVATRGFGKERSQMPLKEVWGKKSLGSLLLSDCLSGKGLSKDVHFKWGFDGDGHG